LIRINLPTTDWLIDVQPSDSKLLDMAQVILYNVENLHLLIESIHQVYEASEHLPRGKHQHAEPSQPVNANVKAA
jgi:hypothetical protein